MRTFGTSETDLVVGPPWRLFIAVFEFVVCLWLLSKFSRGDFFELVVVSGGILLYRNSKQESGTVGALLSRALLVPLHRLHQRADREWPVDPRGADWEAALVGRARGRHDVGRDWGTAATEEQIRQASVALQREFWELVAYPLGDAAAFACAFALAYRLVFDLLHAALLTPWAFFKLAMLLAAILKGAQLGVYAWLDPERTRARWRVRRVEQLGLSTVAAHVFPLCTDPNKSWRVDLSNGYSLFGERSSIDGLHLQCLQMKHNFRCLDAWFTVNGQLARAVRVEVLDEDSWCDAPSMSEISAALGHPTDAPLPGVDR